MTSAGQRSRRSLSNHAVVVASSISVDLEELARSYAFGEITHADYINIRSAMEFRLDQVIHQELGYDS